MTMAKLLLYVLNGSRTEVMASARYVRSTANSRLGWTGSGVPERANNPFGEGRGGLHLVWELILLKEADVADAAVGIEDVDVIGVPAEP
jgi:hypothetical protein